jgi:hypothetical protein
VKCPHKFGFGHGNKTKNQYYIPYIVDKQVFKINKSGKLEAVI